MLPQRIYILHNSYLVHGVFRALVNPDGLSIKINRAYDLVFAYISNRPPSRYISPDKLPMIPSRGKVSSHLAVSALEKFPSGDPPEANKSILRGVADTDVRSLAKLDAWWYTQGTHVLGTCILILLFDFLRFLFFFHSSLSFLKLKRPLRIMHRLFYIFIQRGLSMPIFHSRGKGPLGDSLDTINLRVSFSQTSE